jgi:hypothetical protein
VDYRSRGLARLVLASCVLSLGISGCRGSAASPDGIRERLPSGGERNHLAQAEHPPLAIDTVAVWHLWRSPHEYEFGDVRSVAGAPDGFYLLDRVDQQIVQVSRHRWASILTCKYSIYYFIDVKVIYK